MTTNSILSERQRDELAILGYLNSCGFTEAFAALKHEAKVHDYDPVPAQQKYGNMLEKKWTSVIRLQRKIMELETKNTQMQDELNNAPPSLRKMGASDGSGGGGIPRSPARLTLAAHRGPVTRIAFHPVYHILASASDDTTIKIWDYESGDYEKTLKGHTKTVNDVTFDPKGNYLVSCSSDMTIKVWDVNNGYVCLRTLYGHDHSVSSVRVLPSGDMILSASRDKTVKLWELASGYCVKTINAHTDWIRSAITSDDGKMLLTCSNDQTACVWEMAKGETRIVLGDHDHVVENGIFLPSSSNTYMRELMGGSRVIGRESGPFVATASRDKTIKLWDSSSGQLIRTLTGHDNWVRSVAIQSDGRYLLSASDDKTIKVWDLKTGRCCKTIEAHDHFVTCISACHQLPVVATCSLDQTIKIWQCR